MRHLLHHYPVCIWPHTSVYLTPIPGLCMCPSGLCAISLQPYTLRLQPRGMCVEVTADNLWQFLFSLYDSRDLRLASGSFTHRAVFLTPTSQPLLSSLYPIDSQSPRPPSQPHRAGTSPGMYIPTGPHSNFVFLGKVF